MRVAWILLSLAFVLLCALPASAQEDPGSWFQQGAEAYARGDYPTAARAFEKAHALRPHAAALFNRARCLEKLGDTPRAADAYAGALLRGELRPADKAEAEQRLNALASTLGSLEITGPVGASGSIGHVPMTALPLRTFLMTGRYELSLRRADGQTGRMTVAIGAGQLTRVPLADSGAPWPLRGSTGAKQLRFERRLRVPVEAYVAFAGAGVAAGVGAYLGSEGLAARNEFEASRRTDANRRDRALSLRTWANLAFGAALLSSLTGVALVYRASTLPVAVSLNMQPSNARLPMQLGISGKF